jgi:hypothetical protein
MRDCGHPPAGTGRRTLAGQDWWARAQDTARRCAGHYRQGLPGAGNVTNHLEPMVTDSHCAGRTGAERFSAPEAFSQTGLAWLALFSAVLMPHRLNSIARRLLPTVVSTLVIASPLAAQTGAKVLTPPKRADSTARPAATRPGAPKTMSPASAESASVVRPASAVPQGAVLDSIRETVFRNLLERDRAGLATLASAFCLALSNDNYKSPGSFVDRVDAAEGMVRRLYTPRAPARRASGCTFSGNTSNRGVPGRALLYTVGAITLDESRAEAAAGYNYDGYSAGGYTFTLERGDSSWVVKQWRLEWTGKP